jgi:hypothetical protein
MKYYLSSNVEAGPDDRFHAIQVREDGHYRCYRADASDVESLIEALSSAGIDSEHLLSTDYWQNESQCRLVDIATCEGDCLLGEGCELKTTRGFYYCTCSPRKQPEIGE